MTRWLQAAQRASDSGTKPTEPTEPNPEVRAVTTDTSESWVLSVSSVLSEEKKPARRPASADTFVAAPRARKLEIACCASDPETLLAFLRQHGPQTYGAAASALGWGATRAWQAEARLRADDLVRHAEHGKVCARVADLP